MTTPYLGEIRMFGGNFAPKGWALCDGQTMSIQQNTALFALIGTTYGGNGQTTFNLPDVRGRLPVGQGQGPGLSTYVIGELTGTENVTVLVPNMPMHNHQLVATSAPATTVTISNTVQPGALSTGRLYLNNTGTPAPTFGQFNPIELTSAGGSQPHSNLMPSLCVTFMIALVGIFPSRN